MEPEFQLPQAGRNRVLDLVLLHTEQETEHRVNNPASKREDPNTVGLQRKHYESTIAAYRKTKGLTPEEKKTLRFVRHELRKITAKQNPEVLTQILYNRFVNKLFNLMIGRQQNYGNHDKILASYEKNTALEANTDNLLHNMREQGFKNHLEGAIRKMLAHNVPEFSLRYFDIEKPDTDYVLHFKKLEGTDAYYFDKFDASNRLDAQTQRRNNLTPSMVTISLAQQMPLNAEEARQLLSGKPIKRNTSGENAWIIKDNAVPTGVRTVNFDLKAALKKWPIKEMRSAASAQALINDLNAGRERQITLYLPDGTEKSLKVSLGPDANGESFQLLFRNKAGLLVDATRMVEGQNTSQKVLQKIQASKVAKAKMPFRSVGI